MNNYDKEIECTVNSEKKMLTDGFHLYQNGKKIPFKVKACVGRINIEGKYDDEYGKYDDEYYDIDDPVLQHYGFQNVRSELRISTCHSLDENDYGQIVYGRTYYLSFKVRCQYDTTLSSYEGEDQYHQFASHLQSIKPEHCDWFVTFVLGLEKDGEFVAFDDLNWCEIPNELEIV